MGIATPLCFACQVVFIKHLVLPPKTYNATTVTLSSMGFVGAITLILGASWYWQEIEPFNMKLFLIGVGGSLFDCIGMVSTNHAYTLGPAGPVAALLDTSAIILTIIASLRWMICPLPL